MHPGQAERYLSRLYLVCGVASLTSLLALVFAWQQWAWTLDVCISFDCGCILYGVSSFSTFMGGHVRICRFCTWALAPALVFGFFLGCYHGYRSYICRNLDDPRLEAPVEGRQFILRPEIKGSVIVVSPKPRNLFKQWMPMGFVAILIACLSLAQAIVLTDGYFETCKEYRRNLVTTLGSFEREAQAIHNRLSCGAILDFMDYVHKDTNNWRRSDFIVTSIALQTAIVTSWLNFFAWVTISVINFVVARQTKLISWFTC